MKNIFADLYNKVVNFFYKTDTENAKDVACSRLKLVLMQDRTNLPPIVMDRMKRELIELLSKYVELDRELLDLNFEQEDEQMALMLSIPVIRAKNDEEIQAIIEKEEQEKNQLKNSDNEAEDDDDLSLQADEENDDDSKEEIVDNDEFTEEELVEEVEEIELEEKEIIEESTEESSKHNDIEKTDNGVKQKTAACSTDSSKTKTDSGTIHNKTK